MGRHVTLSRAGLGCAVVLALLLPLAASSDGSAAVRPHIPQTFNVAEHVGLPADNIFPFNSCAQFQATNTQMFQPPLFRPLYWYGFGPSAGLKSSLSIGDTPTFTSPSSGGFLHVTFKIKPWHYADGKHVDAGSVMFFLNLLKSEEANFCLPSPGYGLPDQLKSATAPHGLAGTEVSLTFSSPVNRAWILGDGLSSVVPLPSLWDKRSTTGASGSGGCEAGHFGLSSTAARCRAVYRFLEAQAKATSHYSTNPLWRDVDGPYRLGGYAAGTVILLPNIHYSGPVRSHVARVVLHSYGNEATEEAALASHQLQQGQVVPADLTSSPSIGSPGTNTLPGLGGTFSPSWDPTWTVDYATFNLASQDPSLPIVSQAWFRNLLYAAADEPSVISSVYDGYAYPDCSPLPPTYGPPNPCGNTYSLTSVMSTLNAHGFHYSTDTHTTSCVTPGGCGPNLPQGYKLRLSLAYTNDFPSLPDVIGAEVAAWANAGIVVTPTAQPLAQVVSDCAGATFALCDVGGWNYIGTDVPSGEQMLTATGSGDYGRYDDATMTSLIAATTGGGANNLGAYGTYAGAQAPNLWQPDAVTISELAASCSSSLPANPQGVFLPEYVSGC